MNEKIYEELNKASGWMKFLGILCIISGALSALTLLGIIVAWLPIWLGVLLYQAGNLANSAFFSKEEIKFLQSISKIRLIFMIAGITAIVYIAISLIVLTIVLTTGALIGLLGY
jgi:uncharacterized membrane protein HdeD (DUF308 family)